MMWCWACRAPKLLFLCASAPRAHAAPDVHSSFASRRCSSHSRSFTPPPPISTTPSPLTLPAVALYLAIFLPALPGMLAVWKVKDDWNDFDKFLDYNRQYFVFFSCAVGFFPALAIGNVNFSFCRCIHDADPLPPLLTPAAAVAGAAAAATFVGLFPLLCLIAHLRNIGRLKHFFLKCYKAFFLAYAFLPGAAVLIGLFPLSVPCFFIMQNDDD